VGQIHLLANPLLRQKLAVEYIKLRLFGVSSASRSSFGEGATGLAREGRLFSMLR
jgi:hypothetical protein